MLQLQIMKRKNIIFLVLSTFVLGSCNDKESPFPKPEPEPQPYTEYTCPKEGDIYRIAPDTLFVTRNGLYASFNGELEPINPENFQFSIATCKGKFNDVLSASNNPLSWEVFSEGKKIRDTIVTNQGTIRIGELLLPKDIEEIIALKDGEKLDIGVALLNFNLDTIQMNTITVYHREETKK